MAVKKMVILGLGQRGTKYAEYAVGNPGEFSLAAIIENDPRRAEAGKKVFQGVPFFSDYREFLEKKIPADIVAVATQDKDHKEHAIAMMRAGYDLLLEKPISNNEADCRAIYEESKKCGRKVVVCHVLRYTPFYSTVKSIIDSGKLGEIVNVTASENVGFYHQAHSFVRGPWRNSKESSPMILAKCCHDMDILRWLIGKRCLAVSSMGTLSRFKVENAPAGSAQYCSDCSVECPYRAQKLYLHWRWCAAYFTVGELTDENILSSLWHSQYDRCVYHCDNDVVDHEATIAEFEGGVIASHTMTAFSREIYRELHLYGTKAELVGVMEDEKIEIRPFEGEVEYITLDKKLASGNHGGGDNGMMHALYRDLNGEKVPEVTYLDVSLESHLMSFAAEKSRLDGGNRVEIKA